MVSERRLKKCARCPANGVCNVYGTENATKVLREQYNDIRLRLSALRACRCRKIRGKEGGR